MTTKKVIWLLDVDGVINAVTVKKEPGIWPGQWNEGTAFANGMGWPIKWATPVRDFIVEMSSLVDIRWHTTWQHDAVSIERLLNLPHFPVADAPEFSSPRLRDSWWKLPAAIRAVNTEYTNLIWTDDDLWSNEQDDFYDETTVALWAGVRSLLITPYTELGLEQEHLDQIRDFVFKINESSVVVD